MNTPIDDGGPAYPQPNHLLETQRGTEQASGWMDETGMRLRDYFAGQALAPVMERKWSHINDEGDKVKAWANASFIIADAMLIARKGGPES